MMCKCSWDIDIENFLMSNFLVFDNPLVQEIPNKQSQYTKITSLILDNPLILKKKTLVFDRL